METFWDKLRLSDAWRYKAPLIFGAIYMVIFQEPEHLHLKYLILSIFTIIGIAGIGYLSNDWGDRAADQKSGKPNFFNDHASLIQIASVLVIITIAFFPWYFFPSDRYSWLLISIEIVTFLVYGLPPFELKKTKWIAPVLDALYAHVIPATLAAYTFMLATNEINKGLLAFLALWQLLFGIRAFINHLIADRSNDLLNYPTLATTYDFRQWHYYLFLWSVMEFSIFSYMIWTFSSDWTLMIIVGIGAIYLILKPFYYSFRENAIDKLYLNYWPLILLISIALEIYWYWFAALAHVLLFRSFSSSIKEFWLLRKLRNFISAFVNHGIYWFRRIVLFQSDKVARRQYFEQYMLEKKNINKRKNGTVTIVNLHKDKYSETFIHHYKTELPYAVDFLHGEYPPHLDENNQSLLGDSHWQIMRNKYLEALSGRPDSQLIKKLTLRLRQTNSKIILAHFGPMAVSMLPAVKITGIPMIVYFHAYDVHHQGQLKNYQEQYQELFKTAHLLIGSSQEVVNKLIELGASPSKVKNLPAYFPVKEFQKIERKPQPNSLLAVGRFTTTKSPQILILSFAEVLKIIPQAKLTIIGEGELLEATMNLAKALQIEKNMIFLGKQSPEEVKQQLANAQVFVQHSATTPLHHDREGTPVAIMEAMTAGLPIVSTRHAGIQELITHEENGLLVNELDYKAMAHEILNLLKNPEMGDKLGKNAQNSILNNPLIMNHMQIMTEIIDNYGLTS